MPNACCAATAAPLHGSHAACPAPIPTRYPCSLKLLDTDALRIESLRRLKGEAEGEGQRRKVVVSGHGGLQV